MFDIDQPTVSDAIANSQDYKLLRVNEWLYVIPADADFTPLNESRHSDALARQAVLAISPVGEVRSSRYGRTG